MDCIYPTYGSELGNSRVIIHGSNFISSPLLRVRWVDSSTLIVYTPALLNNETTKSVKLRFELSTAVGVSISPKSGFWIGGKSITLSGSNLIDTSNNLWTVSDIWCRFYGFVIVAPISVNETHVVCQVRNADEFYGLGMVELTVDNSNNDEKYLYMEYLIITSIVPQ